MMTQDTKSYNHKTTIYWGELLLPLSVASLLSSGAFAASEAATERAGALSSSTGGPWAEAVLGLLHPRHTSRLAKLCDLHVSTAHTQSPARKLLGRPWA